MCGIVGYIGNKKAEPILLNGLSSLEYRGYDSAGLATIEKNTLQVLKDEGRVSNLVELSQNNISNSNIGIAHTRWATHGKPSKENAHPHVDNYNIFAVVHNGIIENYIELKNFLIEKGYNFLSQTDTEVIPNLIHYFHMQNNDFLHSVNLACKKLVGSYAINVICSKDPNRIIVCKKDSPLVIGKGINEFFIGSDIPAILPYTKDFFFMDDFELADITRDSITFYNYDLDIIHKSTQFIDLDNNAACKNGYEDFMLKEIYEQPNSIKQTIKDFDFDYTLIKNYNKIYIVACGTAMHAGLVGKHILEDLCRIPTQVDIASEFRYRKPIIDKQTLAIFISQSGETADTIAALKLAKSEGATTLAITNVLGSSITREADNVLYTKAGPEIAVASTKAYTSQVSLLAKIAINFAEVLNSYPNDKLKELKQELLDLPEKINITLQTSNIVSKIAKQIYTEHDMYYIGRGIDYYSCMEAALKLKEISYIHSECYASGELKHGAIALIEDEITVISCLTNLELLEKSISNIQEVKTRGAKTIVITNQELSNEVFDYKIEIPKVNPLLSPILSVIPLQFLAYYIAKEKGLDVDKPRNLAKSVTVE